MKEKQEIKLYHKIPDDMRGNVLYPMNELKNSEHRDLYPIYASRYEKRPRIMDIDVLPLGVKWNDVIHLTPIHPDIIKAALQGINKEKGISGAFFEIDANELDPQNATIFYEKNPLSKSVSENDFHEFTHANLSKYTNLPDRTVQYYKKELDAGRIPFLHHGAPHILYKGNIKVDPTKIIEPK